MAAIFFVRTKVLSLSAFRLTRRGVYSCNLDFRSSSTTLRISTHPNRGRVARWNEKEENRGGGERSSIVDEEQAGCVGASFQNANRFELSAGYSRTQAAP
uniref:Uncharacterized protein n=1 Tax=Vespula pensylvanica TaxID=30213 RepID=A0A834JV48_VESPE|nr:hypothetical protein H0235_016776 [Vespula pensylvanica]